MRKLKIFPIIFAVAAAFFALTFGFSVAPVACADGNAYIKIPDATPLSQLNNASVSSVKFKIFAEDGDIRSAFYLPTTYYVKVTGNKITLRNLEYYPVLYNGHDGLVYLSDFGQTPEPQAVPAVDALGENGEAPTFNLTYTAAEPTQISGKSVDGTWTITYMGEAVSDAGAAVSDAGAVFVKCQKAGESAVYGVIQKANFSAFTIPLHQVTIDEKAALSTPDGSVQENKRPDDAVIRTVLIIGIVIPAVLIIVLLFVPRRRADNYDTYSRRISGNSKYDRADRYEDDRYGRRGDAYRGGDYRAAGKEDAYRYGDDRRYGAREKYYDDDYD
jgi:uncharacterized protein YxeA